MSTEDNKRSVIVGIFVFLAIVILVTGIFTLAGQQKRFINTITLQAVFDDVGGLKPGNNVWFSGVKIGTVKAIDLFGESQVLVTIGIEERAQQFIHENAIARISSESFIGNKNIVIEGGTQEASLVEDGDRIRAVNPIDTDELMETLQVNNRNLAAITTDLRQLTNNLLEGEGTVGALLTDEGLANDFQATLNNLQQASQNTIGATRELSRFTSKLNTPGGLANEVLTDTTAFSQVKRSLAQLEQATTSAATLTENLQEVSGRLNNENNAVNVLLSDEEFARNLQSTLQNLETSTQKFDENMEALQSNFLFRGFFRRRAKEEARQREAELERLEEQREEVQ
ncbi:phospholipid/cholesterol/gamma-HCH transport system substrate-binding protein [Pontibacter ummariensis]|uniref:Phospholipid/cholesterol/gamma-HCH transport system substrate-binding protein n=1 Tax=Pontibacter ummariensis TaxID=1610492 RepID=A0A239KPF0_9BACT|nr:MlaD family protein [Pontibacter ummariensis]PRY05366.1 phospholipid/cholesterol/gamma-HCH transport system substrate-binding protein [Pontibacter ummariensis]SNT19945.1 phospholipid/cholesterol/gamma-HCH transport system substrate-binding protein [Pontibacter ummariensis]